MKLSEEQALYRIAVFCSKAERAESDILKKLSTWELEPSACYRIINHLKKENYLNEERFCRSFVNDKMRFNRWGRNKIIFELKKKRISENLIQNVLAEIEDQETEDTFESQLESLILNKMKTVKGKDKYDIRNKLLRFALGRGFTIDQSIKCINKLMNESFEDDF